MQIKSNMSREQFCTSCLNIFFFLLFHFFCECDVNVKKYTHFILSIRFMNHRALNHNAIWPFKISTNIWMGFCVSFCLVCMAFFILSTTVDIVLRLFLLKINQNTNVNNQKLEPIVFNFRWHYTLPVCRGQIKKSQSQIAFSTFFATSITYTKHLYFIYVHMLLSVATVLLLSFCYRWWPFARLY